MADSNPGRYSGARGDAAVAAALNSRGGERPGAGPDDSAALAGLAQQLADDPHGLLQRVADLARALCGADSVVIALRDTGPGHDAGEGAGAGRSEPDNDGGSDGGQAAVGIRWCAVSGRLAPHHGVHWPAAACPCGASILADGAVLFERPAQEFPSIRATGLRIGETLGVPWRVQGRVEGSLNAMMADGDVRRFDADDLRRLRACAAFAAAAHRAYGAALADGVLEREVAARLRPVLEREEHLQREVAESRAAERLLREHKALIDATLSVRTVGVMYFDLDGTVHDVNEAFARMSGYTCQELNALPHWRDLTPPEFWCVTERALRDLAEGGTTAPYTKQMLRKDGSRWWGLFAPARISGAGVQGRCVLFVIDVSENKENEEALRASEGRFRALADASPALVWQFDADGRVIYLNQRCIDDGACGAAAGAAGWRNIVPPADMDAYLCAVFAAIRTDGSFVRRIETPVRGGALHWFESHASPWLAGDGALRGYVGISLDITAAVQAEEALREADRRKDEFLATLAHELRNPLAPISNAVQLMRRPDGRRQSDRVVEMVGRQVRQIVRLVDDLMEVSRIARGKVDLKLERVPFAEIVRSAVESCQPAIERAGHQLAVALPEEPLVLEADRVRLTQVFANLLGNAAKYTDAGGRIWLDVRRDGDMLVASVRDTGIGIPPAELGRVFDMFAQAHRAVGRGQGGLGIGLTMVKSLVEMHHGTVEARSAGSGQGSEFLVRLPLALPAGACDHVEPLGQARPAAPLHGQRILVVDDNRDAADTLGLLLEADGADVRVVYDGRGALAMAETFLPTSVLLDIGMPGMDGYEVARRLRQDGRFGELRIVALTGWGQDADRRQTRNRGFSHHLTKPVGLEELHAILS
ncbi:PAS domain S-box protein [uncultured Massilia sp.]|uniref:PAS domain-containing hybrid sensor histidine kinase/response regulator n=1 Tax=uncultured Massilia sp. TaxID=169973 RepID=UPI0025D725B0|nr:PAS domain S-box protein [uncultured Massilia sp.]